MRVPAVEPAAEGRQGVVEPVGAVGRRVGPPGLGVVGQGPADAVDGGRADPGLDRPLGRRPAGPPEPVVLAAQDQQAERQARQRDDPHDQPRRPEQRHRPRRGPGQAAVGWHGGLRTGSGSRMGEWRMEEARRPTATTLEAARREWNPRSRPGPTIRSRPLRRTAQTGSPGRLSFGGFRVAGVESARPRSGGPLSGSRGLDPSHQSTSDPYNSGSPEASFGHPHRSSAIRHRLARAVATSSPGGPNMAAAPLAGP